MKKILSIILASLMLLGSGITAYAQDNSQANVIEVLTTLGAQKISDVYFSQGDILVKESSGRIDFNDTSYALLDDSNSIIMLRIIL